MRPRKDRRLCPGLLLTSLQLAEERRIARCGIIDGTLDTAGRFWQGELLWIGQKHVRVGVFEERP
jgi:hypothetical protein